MLYIADHSLIENQIFTATLAQPQEASSGLTAWGQALSVRLALVRQSQNSLELGQLSQGEPDDS